MYWRETVTSMSDRVFPGLSYNIDNSEEVNSNLFLQMSLYYNVIFLPLWLIVTVLFVNYQFEFYNDLYKLFIITIIIILFPVEFIRLYLGYQGNLKDKIPELAGFWMLSLFLQLPLQGFLLFNPYFYLGIVQIISQGLMFILLIFQLISGYIALKYTAKQQAILFRIMKLSSNVTLEDIKERYKVK